MEVIVGKWMRQRRSPIFQGFLNVRSMPWPDHHSNASPRAPAGEDSPDRDTQGIEYERCGDMETGL
jgi:hypothetical protein